jgi:hypothetical protein
MQERADGAYQAWSIHPSASKLAWFRECEAKAALARRRANWALTAYIRLYNAANAAAYVQPDWCDTPSHRHDRGYVR